MKMSEVGKICMCKRIMKSQTANMGDVPFYKIGTFGKKPDAYIPQELFNEYKNKFSFPKTGEVLISASGTIGKTVVYDGKPAYFQDSNIVWLANDETKVLNKFLFHIYAIQPWKISYGGTIARLYNDLIRNTIIPVPPIAEQQRIVNLLDKFDKLTNDLTVGLPAEIAMRKKQYKYYRNKLFSFKKVGA